MKKEVIYGKVIQIINEYTVVIDIGYEQNSNVGKIVQVFKKIPINNIDGKLINHIEFNIAQLKVDKIFEDYSLCSSNEYDYSMFPNIENEVLPLNVNPEENLGISDEDEVISIGVDVKIELGE